MKKATRVHYEPPIRTLNGWDMRMAGTETKIEQEECDREQAEEMAKATMKHCKIDNQCGSCRWTTCNECLSEVLYSAGYRKQSEVAREIFEEFESIISPMLGLEDDKEYVAIVITAFAELKKKYAEAKND